MTGRRSGICLLARLQIIWALLLAFTAIFASAGSGAEAPSAPNSAGPAVAIYNYDAATASTTPPGQLRTAALTGTSGPPIVSRSSTSSMSRGRAAKGAPRIAGGAVPRGPVRPHQIHGLDEALEYAKRNGGRIRRDSTPFRDSKGLLPPGSYQEWTVRTPGVAGRGARRLVYDREAGRAFYTWNHYEDFVEVVLK